MESGWTSSGWGECARLGNLSKQPKWRTENHLTTELWMSLNYFRIIIGEGESSLSPSDLKKGIFLLDHGTLQFIITCCQKWSDLVYCGLQYPGFVCKVYCTVKITGKRDREMLNQILIIRISLEIWRFSADFLLRKFFSRLHFEQRTTACISTFKVE